MNNIKKKRTKTHNIYSIDWQMKRYNISLEEATQKVNNLKEVNAYSIEWQMKRYNITREEAAEKIRERKEKAKKTNNEKTEFERMSISRYRYEFWIKKGFTIEEAKQKAWEAIDKNRKIFERKRKENPEQYKDSYNTHIEFYINKGYSIEEAKVMLSERQRTFSLEKCIKKFGEIEGTKRYQERQEKWQDNLTSKPTEEIKRINSLKSTNLENFIRKYGKELGEEKYKSKCYGTTRTALVNKYGSEEEYIKKLRDKFTSGYSQIGKIFVEDIIKTFNITEHSSCLNNEFALLNINGNGNYRYDFKYNNKIIEFNGDYWHANPKFYTDVNEVLYNKLSVKDIRKNDENKEQIAKEAGFDYLTIWEFDYHNNYEETMKKIEFFIKED